MRRYLWYLALLLAIVWPAIAQTAQHSIKLTCTAGTNDVTFSFYRATTSGGPYTKIANSVASCAFNDTTGTGGVKYFYVSTGIDSAGVESVNSTEASATFLAAPGAPGGMAAQAQ